MTWLTSLCMRHPIVTCLVFLVWVAHAGLQADRLEEEIGIEGMLGSGHESIAELDAFIERFGGGQPVLVAWRCGDAMPCADVFDDASLHMAEGIRNSLLRSPSVIGVLGPSNAPVLVVDQGQGFASRSFVEDGEIISERDVLRSQALTDPSWRGRLVSADGKVGALLVETASTRTVDAFRVMADLDIALAPARDQGFDLHVLGQAVVDTALSDGSKRDGLMLSLAVGGILVFVVRILTGSWAAVLGTLAATGGGALAVFFLLALFGLPRDPVTAASPMLVMVIGSATVLHLFSGTARRVREGNVLEDAIRQECAALWMPGGLAALTTIAALLSYTTADLATLIRFGWVTAAGVAVAFGFAFTLLPAIMVLLRTQGDRDDGASWQRVVSPLADFALDHPGRILAATLVLTLLCGVGFSRLQVGTDLLGYWRADHPLPTARAFIDAHLRPTDSLELELILPEGQTLADSANLASLSLIEDRLVDFGGGMAPTSVLVPLRQMNRILHDDEPAWERLPENAASAGELLMLLSMGSPRSLDALLTFDHRRVRMSLPIESGDAHALQGRVENLESELATVLPSGWEMLITGPVIVNGAAQEATVRSMARSLTLAIGLVFVVLLLHLRSFAWALLAMVPNLLPLLLLGGAMGILSIRFDSASACVATMALGLAVDDTIHLLVAMRRERTSGASLREAMRAAVMRVGRPVITTSVAFALGFLAMLPSSFAAISNMGLLSSLAVLGALGADLLVLPALVSVLASTQDRIVGRIMLTCASIARA